MIAHPLDAGFFVSAWTRNIKTTSQKWATVQIFRGNYEAAEALALSIQRKHGAHDAVVFLLSRDQLEAQIALLDAVVFAGIPQGIPSDCGFELSTPEICSWPWLAAKLAMGRTSHSSCGLERFNLHQRSHGAYFGWTLTRGLH